MLKISSKEIKQLSTQVLKLEKTSSKNIPHVPKNAIGDTFKNGIVYSTATKSNPNTTTLGDAFRAALQNLSKSIVETSEKAKGIAQAQVLAKKQAKESHEVLSKVKSVFQEYIDSFGLSDSVEFFIRAKSLDGAETKIGNKVKKKFKSIQKAAREISTFGPEEILPKIKETSSPKLKEIHAQTKSLLEEHSIEGVLTAAQLKNILDPKMFEQKYGKKGLQYLGKIQQKIDKVYAKKTTEGLQELLEKKHSVSSFAKNPAKISDELRDAIGIRFVAKKPDAAKINALPEEKRIPAIKKHIENQMTQLTSMLMEICQTSATDMTKVTSYGGKNQYLSKRNIQRLQTLGSVDVKESTLASGYTTTQGNLVMQIRHNDKIRPVNIEFQLRGEEVNKFSEVEHIPYDLREGKGIDYKKYSKKQCQMLQQIQQESKKLNKNESLKASYNDYLTKCYDYYFAKEYGIEVPKPQLPKGLDPILSQESLFQLSHK